MAREKLEVEITAKGAKKAADEVEGVADALDDVRTAGQKVAAELSRTADEIAEDLAKSARAADALGSALGPELKARFEQGEMGMSGLIAELQKLGLTFEEIEADADELAASVRKMDEIDPSRFGGKTRAASADVDKMSDSARGANSALANMVGNTAQDVGELGGVSGSTGVAIGQMAEYMSDARLAGEGMGSAMASMAKVLGPILALSAAVGVVGGLLDDQRRKAEESKQRVEEFGDAMQGAADDALGLAESLRENSERLTEFDVKAGDFGGLLRDNLADMAQSLPLVGGLVGDAAEQFNDLVPIMQAAGFSMYDLSKAIEEGGLIGQEWSTVLGEAYQTGKITEEQFIALTQAISQYGDEATRAKDLQSLFNVDLAEANALVASMREPLEQYTTKWAVLMSDLADGSISTQAAVDAINDLATALGLTQAQVVELAQAELDKKLDSLGDGASYAESALQSFADAGYRSTSVAEAAAAVFDTAAEKLGDLDKGARRAADGLNSTTEALDHARTAIDDQEAALDYLDQLDDVAEAYEKIGEAKTETEKTQALRDYQRELLRLQEMVYDLGERYDDLPAEKITQIEAAFRTGNLEEIEAALENLTRNRYITVGVAGSLAGGLNAAFNAAGASFSGGTVSGPIYSGSNPAPANNPVQQITHDNSRITNIYPVGSTPQSVQTDIYIDQKRGGRQ